MNRERALKVVLAIVGLTLLAGLYPLAGALRDSRHSQISLGDQMILGIYFPFGIYMLLAIRNPAANRTFIVAFAWSTISHMAVMFVQAMQAGSLHDDAPPLALFTFVCVILLVLAPPKSPRASAAQVV
jgi:hypothetical protein